jgi:hypothetical protein
MSLRIAWSCYPKNVGLGIAANVFVYVGTIILFMIDWFFVQRVVRAQHQHFGWSTPYRIFHRVALFGLVATLIMVIVANIWQFFTVDDTKLRAFRVLQLIGQTYLTVFCIAPAVLVLISVLIPREEVEKFGAGRLRVNITILLIAVAVLTTGQLFRCVIAWLPQLRVRDDAGVPLPQPWYLHRACFYVFNFVTEIVVVIMFALVRVDLRFYVPNGSRMSGDYSGRNSRVDLNSSSTVALGATASKKSLISKKSHTSIPHVPMVQHRNPSSETLHQYETSVFEDSRTLADSLQYGASTLEVDDKTGAWKVKRISTASSRSSVTSCHSPARSSLHDRSVTFADEDAPPVPEIPAEWPLPSNQPLRKSTPMLEHNNPTSRKGTPKKTFEIADHDLNDADVGDAITDALATLEHNSALNPVRKRESQGTNDRVVEDAAPPPEYTPVDTTPTPSPRKKRLSNPLAPRKRATFPPKSALKTPSSTSTTPTITEAPEVPAPPQPPHKPRPSSLELITLAQRPSLDSRTMLDKSLQGDVAASVPPSTNASRPDTGVAVDEVVLEMPVGIATSSSSEYSGESTRQEAVRAEAEFKRFGDEAWPLEEAEDIMRGRRFD